MNTSKDVQNKRNILESAIWEYMNNMKKDTEWEDKKIVSLTGRDIGDFIKKWVSDGIFTITVKGEKIPFEFFRNNTEIVLNGSKKDYSELVSARLFTKYPKVTSIQHKTYYHSEKDFRL